MIVSPGATTSTCGPVPSAAPRLEKSVISCPAAHWESTDLQAAPTRMAPFPASWYPPIVPGSGPSLPAEKTTCTPLSTTDLIICDIASKSVGSPQSRPRQFGSVGSRPQEFWVMSMPYSSRCRIVQSNAASAASSQSRSSTMPKPGVATRIEIKETPGATPARSGPPWAAERLPSPPTVLATWVPWPISSCSASAPVDSAYASH